MEITRIDTQRPLVSFVIPTMGRDSLERSVDSLYAQTNEDWNAIIIPDPEYDTGLQVAEMEKIQIVEPPTMYSGSAGLLRNHGLEFVTGHWVAFLDDDDAVDPRYVEHLAAHVKDHPRVEVLVFRMNDPKLGILPPLDFPHLVPTLVGISFAYKAELIDEGYRFLKEDPTVRRHEDWDMISQLRDARKKFFISPHIDYKVRPT